MKEYIYNLIPEDTYITRKELVDKTGLSDRLVRKIISDNEKSIKELNEEDLSKAKEDLKELNTLLQDRFRDIREIEEIKVSFNAVKSMLSAA